MFIGCELRKLIRVPKLDDVGRTFVAWRCLTPELTWRFGQDRRCRFIPHQHLWLDSADTGVNRKLLDEIPEQVATAAPARNNLVHRLERDLLLQLLFLASVADTSNLRAADNPQQVKVIKCSRGFGERQPQSFAQHAFW